MKKVLVFLSVALCVLLLWSPVAMAGDAVRGEQVFKAICAACHIGGGNVIQPAKTLKKSALEKYAMLDLNEIITQVTNGKNAMPAFRDRLTPEQINDVATYVLEKAEKGW